MTNDSAKRKNLHEDRRRFKRVYVDRFDSPANAIVGAKAVWPNGKDAQVYDMSYSGAALGNPGETGFEPGEFFPIRLHLPKCEPVEVKAEIMWVNSKVVGVQFGNLSGEARMAINEYLDDKLIGSYLSKIDKRYFGGSLDCDHWYHGPKETNVYLWTDGNEHLTRAEVELEGQLLVLEKGKIQVGYVGDEGGIQALYSETGQGDPSLRVDQDYLLERIVGLLSQIQEPPVAVTELMNRLAVREAK